MQHTQDTACAGIIHNIIIIMYVCVCLCELSRACVFLIDLLRLYIFVHGGGDDDDGALQTHVILKHTNIA